MVEGPAICFNKHKVLRSVWRGFTVLLLLLLKAGLFSEGVKLDHRGQGEGMAVNSTYLSQQHCSKEKSNPRPLPSTPFKTSKRHACRVYHPDGDPRRHMAWLCHNCENKAVNPAPVKRHMQISWYSLHLSHLCSMSSHTCWSCPYFHVYLLCPSNFLVLSILPLVLKL